MRTLIVSAAAAALVAILSQAAAPPARAEGPGYEARAATAGYIARFVKSGKLTDSALAQKGGLIGLGTDKPKSKLDIRAQDALAIRGYQPFVTFRDSNASNARHVIQSVDGGLNLLGDSYLKKTNLNAFVRIDKEGRVGIGNANPVRALQIGPGFDSSFTLDPSDGSPRAGFIRFGDGTGWELIIGRQRNGSNGPLNSGYTGTLVGIRDDGQFRLAGFPLGPVGLGPICRTLSNTITMCQSSSSSLRYKTDITPYEAGLETIERLHPIAFTRTLNGAPGVGLAAEEVEALDPRLAFRNENGEVDGIHYELLSVLFVNAIKAQQQEIAAQTALIGELQARLEKLEAGR